MKKGTVGYLRKKKRFQILYTLLIALVSVALFLIGYFATGSTKNLLTVVAVLGVLPGAKSLVTVVILLPYRSLAPEKAEAFLKCCPEGAQTYGDLVFSSPERVMHLSFLCIVGTECVGLTEEGKQAEKITAYFTETMKKQGVSVHMKVYTSDGEFQKRLSSLKPSESPAPSELTEWLETVLV